MFIAAQFIIAKTWKQSKCSLTEEWINKILYINTMEHYSAIKKSELFTDTDNNAETSQKHYKK